MKLYKSRNYVINGSNEVVVNSEEVDEPIENITKQVEKVDFKKSLF
jgi:hypothetical protein